MTFSSIFQGAFSKIVKSKIFIKLIFGIKQNWICYRIYFRKFGRKKSIKFQQNSFAQSQVLDVLISVGLVNFKDKFF